MDWFLNFLSGGLIDLVKQFGGYIVGALGMLGAIAMAYFSGAKNEKQKGQINTQKEIIDAYEDRRTAEDIVRGTPPTKPGSVRNKYQRD